jgi:CDP-2,3-bis-(O-geranylgeranyl)-sn-glycerol synthase
MTFLIDIFLYAWFPWLVNASFNLFYEIKRKYGFISYDFPFDLGLSFLDGRRILGESTTWGGLIVAISSGLFLDVFFPGHYGLLKAILTFAGHALGSFIKRRMGLARGVYVPIIDHGDYMILIGVVFTSFNLIPISIVWGALFFTLCFQPLICFVCYKIGWRDNPI